MASSSNASKLGVSKLTKSEKKACRKQARKLHSLSKHDAQLTKVSDSPTPHLMIGNGGLMCGVQRTHVLKLFQKFGHIERVVMLPKRSYSFVTFTSTEEAKNAMDRVHGRVLHSPLEFPRPGVTLYLSYMTSSPDQDDVTGPGYEHPLGLLLVKDFVSKDEERRLTNVLGWGRIGDEDISTSTVQQQLRHRRVKHFGYEFLYGSNNVDKSNPLPGGIPDVCDDLLCCMVQHRYIHSKPDQLTVNEYQPGQGIPPHVDTHSAFEDSIAALSLGAQISMDFRHPDGHHVSVVLPQRSLLVMTGESRYLWTHGITPRKYDIVESLPTVAGREHLPDNTTDAEKGTTLYERQTRLSLTFRKIRHTPCNCNYSRQCDSQEYKDSASSTSSSDMPSTEEDAEILEKVHVHEVYEKIAGHFSDTRHTPWPKIAEFLRSQPTGSLVADVGCGNGKYLGINENLFKTGSDRSSNLAAICQQRGFSVVVCDILDLPYRSNAFDVCLCIAVLHHLSTDERRIAGLRELVRVVRPGGLVLVYVWALEQDAKKVKQSQLKEVKFGEAAERENKSVTDSLPTRQISEDNTCHASGHASGNAGGNAGGHAGGHAGCETLHESNKEKSKTLKLRVNASRSSFEQQDLFVPWRYRGVEKSKGKEKDTQSSLTPETPDDKATGPDVGHVYHRYYHVFQEGELLELCGRLDNVKVRDCYYEKGNWSVLLEKTEKN